MRAIFYFRFIAIHLLLLTVFRVVFYLYFKSGQVVSFKDISTAFFLGLRFDLRLTLLLMLPLLFSFGSISPFRSSIAMRSWRFLYTGLFGIVFLLYFLDFGFFAYLNSRMNSAIMEFFQNPDISLGMLWSSYPMVWITLGFCSLLFIYTLILKIFVFTSVRQKPRGWPQWTVTTSFVFLFLTGLYGSVSQYPLRWSDAFFSHHNYLSHLALNPVLYFAETYNFAKAPGFDREKVKAYYPLIKDFVGALPNSSKESYQIPRPVKAIPRSEPMNVVVIVMESLAMSKTSLSNNPLDPTPNVARIAREGLLFNHYYSPCEGTARNIFSIMTAIPDVTKVETSTRNPLVVDQKLIANNYKDYRKLYFLGGSASWANIRGIFSNNIQGVEIVEEGAFDKSKTDVWGLSDLDLFIEADKVFTSSPRHQPFFAVIQAASFHRPYTIPENALGFKKQPMDIEKLKNAGFYSQEQWDSLRFSDYSLGHFFELAKTKPYFKNTLFVITGDHGLPDDGGANVSPGYKEFGIARYHVPLIFYNQQLIPEPRIDSRPAGHVDLMTSAADLAGVDHENTTLGRSLFNTSYDSERYAFIYNYYSEIGEFGLMGSQFYYRYDDIKKGQLYNLSSENPTEDLKMKEPEVFERMERVAQAHMEYSRYLLFNNQKQK